MGKRSGTVDTEDAVAALSVAELNGEIARCDLGARLAGTSVGRKAFLKRLIWLESLREKYHQVPAAKRHARRR